MTGSVRAGACLDPETVAAYLDGRLTSAEMREIEVHLADCDDCRELTTGTAKVVEAMDAEDRLSGPRRRALWVKTGVLGLAAAVALVLVAPRDLLHRLRPTPDSSTLAAAVGAKRLIEGRLVGGFAYGPLIGDTRAGEGQGAASPEVVIAAARLEQVLVRRRDARTLTAFGAGQLLTGHVDEAVAALEEAHALDGADATVLIDLSSAYFEKSRRVPIEQANALIARAVEAAAIATRHAPNAPEAWFNLALLQERRGDVAGSITSWRKFLSVERDPGWIEEGRRHLTELERRSA